MPRRPPPSSLLLVKGPLPARGQAKHTLPSVPRPVHVPHDASRTVSRAAPEPRVVVASPSSNSAYARAHTHSSADLSSSVAYKLPRRRSVERGLDTSGLTLPALPSASGMVGGAVGVAGHASPMSVSPSTTPSPGSSPSPRPPMRGPWDHSRAVSLPIDVGSVLALPKPVAISP